MFSKLGVRLEVFPKWTTIVRGEWDGGPSQAKILVAGGPIFNHGKAPNNTDQGARGLEKSSIEGTEP